MGIVGYYKAAIIGSANGNVNPFQFPGDYTIPGAIPGATNCWSAA
jgi:hypothetical protein